MTTTLKLMCVLAHPDDESLGTGAILAKYAAEGVETCLVTATRGERGWTGHPNENPGLAELGRIREGELRAAATELGVRDLVILPYIDGDLDQADAAEATARIAAEIRRFRPQVIVSFGPDGAYGHPDHIAISQLATAAALEAASAGGEHPPHRVDKLYYFVIDEEHGRTYETHMGSIAMTIDGVVRRLVVWPAWAISARIDASDHWQTVWRAVACHQTQLPNYHVLAALSPEQHRLLWGRQTLYRVWSTVNGGREVESDLFAGLRD